MTRKERHTLIQDYVAMGIIALIVIGVLWAVYGIWDHMRYQEAIMTRMRSDYGTIETVHIVSDTQYRKLKALKDRRDANDEAYERELMLSGLPEGVIR